MRIKEGDVIIAKQWTDNTGEVHIFENNSEIIFVVTNYDNSDKHYKLDCVFFDQQSLPFSLSLGDVYKKIDKENNPEYYL